MILMMSAMSINDMLQIFVAKGIAKTLYINGCAANVQGVRYVVLQTITTANDEPFGICCD